MLFHSSLLSRGTMLFFSMGLLLFAPVSPGQAEELANPCKGLRGKELVLCWKNTEPARARGEHEEFHREQSTLHLKWHQEHRGTDAQATIDHQKFHENIARKHQESHRSSHGQGKDTEKTVSPSSKALDAKGAPNKGLSKKRQRRQGM